MTVSPLFFVVNTHPNLRENPVKRVMARRRTANACRQDREQHRHVNRTAAELFAGECCSGQRRKMRLGSSVNTYP
jgi:hypothetical protein